MQTKLDQIKQLAAKPAETKRGNEKAAKVITIANQVIRGAITPAQGLAKAMKV